MHKALSKYSYCDLFVLGLVFNFKWSSTRRELGINEDCAAVLRIWVLSDDCALNVVLILAKAFHHLCVAVVLCFAICCTHKLSTMSIITVLFGFPYLGLALGGDFKSFAGKGVQSGIGFRGQFIQLILRVLRDLVIEIVWGFEVEWAPLVFVNGCKQTKNIE